MLQIIRDQTFNPYFNLAMEKWLCDHNAGQRMLYLWQNERTVVIGKNQDPLKECRLRVLEADGGHLARRCSGGGAVYHDLGNLNFTFLMPREQFDLHTQCSVVLKAVQSFGIHAEFSGRNDLLVQGRKFSGNAFYHGPHSSFHHGTLMVDTDSEQVSRYLQVSRDKLRSNGVDSVRQRIINLKECCPQLNIEALKTALIEAMSATFNEAAQPWSPSAEERQEIEALAAVYRSSEWLYPARVHADLCAARRFEWGEVQLELAWRGDQIQDCRLYSDAMETEPLQQLQQALKGRPVTAILNRESEPPGLHSSIASECLRWMQEILEGQENT